MPSLEGKRALITGGSAGIGAAVARLLAQRGVKVAINYSANRDRAASTLNNLSGSGHVVVQGDAFDRAGITNIVNSTVKQLGGIDIVVSNAGWTTFGPFNDLNAVSDDGWMQCYKTNVLSHLWLMQACQSELEQRKGAFVVSASVAGLKPSGSSMAYSVSKSATIHLVKSLALACAPTIRVNAVAAGVMLTEWSKGFTKEHIAEVERVNALNKVTDVEDVASMYVTLLENTSITGQCIEVSSGFRL